MSKWNRREWLCNTGAWGTSALGLGGWLLHPGQSAFAQDNGTERSVEPRIHREDKADIWTLNFRFKDPRVIAADIPGRGTKVIWYMWYQVINQTGELRDFIPNFELVTLDKNTVHQDEVLPSVENLIRVKEDPNNRLDMQNSVTIMKKPIPVTKPDSYPRAVTGLAIWSDVYDRAKDTNRFSIFITGLSNGWTIDENKVIRRKTLQLNFVKLGDSRKDDIRWAETYEWKYRATATVKAKGEEASPTPMNEPKAEEKK